MMKEILDSTQSSMDNAINHTVKELKKIRTGRANPEILNSIYIDYYGSKTALNQVSTITTPEARLINIIGSINLTRIFTNLSTIFSETPFKILFKICII